MKKLAFVFVLLTTMSCAQDETIKETVTTQEKATTEQTKKQPHKYGGWYCPDNLNGFPAVDLKNWHTVPVISGRLPTKEETTTGASLMYIDKTEYPEAKAMDISLPQLAKYYNEYSKQEELVVVIQAVVVGNDSVVGFRYLNGGNGSARYDEVNFMNDIEVGGLPDLKYVTHSIKIEKANQGRVWEVLTDREYLSALQPSFQGNVLPGLQWRDDVVMNYYFAPKSELSNAYADKLFGSYYIQRDYQHNSNNYVEKFLVLENKEENYTELKIVVGPFLPEAFETQEAIIKDWAKRVREVIVKC